MEAFHWDTRFETGIPEVDGQHRHLVDVLNRYGELLSEQTEVTSAETDAVFAELAEYAVYHFSAETGLMVAAHLDERHVALHRQEHEGFVREVARLHGSITQDDTGGAGRLMEFLCHWLVFHILGSDQIMARQVRAIEQGESAASAYLSLEQTADSATATLLDSLNRLFRLVSERNRELTEANATLEARVAARTIELTIANERLEAIAMSDALTGLPNRRHAMSRLELEWSRSVRDHTPLSTLMIDADGFKQVNNEHGHDAGDLVIRQLAVMLRDAARTDDVVCRLGGDEFLVVCPRTPLAGALHLGELLRRAVSAMRVPAGAGEWKGSISVGVAQRSEAMASAADLLKSADEAVYVAKHRGRDCVAAAHSI